jgi:outer membrane lipoprotein carrier protein
MDAANGKFWCPAETNKILMQRIALFLIALSACPVMANGLNALESFLKTSKSARAEFTQTVTSPSKDGQVPRIKTSSGSFEFLRPNRFKFVYRKPFEQTLLADGQTLWMHDVDLNQVTASKQANVLNSTPAALIASAPDLKALQQNFNLQAAPDKDGLQWVTATPNAKEGSLQSIRVGFKTTGQLAALDMLDSFGQRSVLSFQSVEINPTLPESTFVFKPPQGADVIKQ